MSIKTIERAQNAYDYPLLIKNLLHTPRATAGGQQIVYRDVVRHDYNEALARIGQLASGLSALGVAPGDVVAMMDWDSHRYLEAFFAAPMMGATLMTVNVRLNPEQILYTLNHAGPKVLLINADFLPIVAAIKDRLATIEHYVLISDAPFASQSVVDFACEYEILLLSGKADYPFPDFDENARATLFYTTGTTGLPKGVSFSHRQIVLHTLATGMALGLGADQGRLHRRDVYMPITPMFHVHAWGMPYIATLAGIKQVYPGRYAPDLVLKLRADEGVTFSHCVPTILQMILSHRDIDNYDLSGWKMIIGGSALPSALAHDALRRGMDVFTGYGMSETCPILTLAQVRPERLENPEDPGLAQRLRAGTPIPLVDLRVVDHDMKDVAHDGKTPGEVVARAPWLTQSYLNNPEASETLWAGGFLHTNDIGNIDSFGSLQITDRIKDVIKTGGEWVSSLEVEDILLQHPAVAEAAVIGVADAKWGERPRALVVLKADLADPPDADALKDFMQAYVDRGVISKFGIPRDFVFIDAMLKTSVGKLNKRALRDAYGAA